MKHFKIQEYVSPEMYERRGLKALELLDQRLLATMDSLRENLGQPITINNWIWGGTRKASGLRDEHYYGSGYAKSLSQHKYGRAADFIVKNMKAYEVRKHILENLELYPFIKFIEVGSDMTWCHIDVRNREELVCWDKNSGLFVSKEHVISHCL